VEAKRKHCEQELRDFCTAVLAPFPDASWQATEYCVEGDPRRVLCEMASELKANTVVIGSRGLGTIGRALMGSVSDYLAHHCTCPVVIVRA
jgi:nucleotide-binding universal stress UspA family protein